MASRIVLATSARATGPVHQVRGMVTAVDTGAFILETTNGVRLHGRRPAVRVTYANAPIGVLSRHAMRATVIGVSGNVLRLALPDGGGLSVAVLPSAVVDLNGQASSLAQIPRTTRCVFRGCGSWSCSTPPR